MYRVVFESGALSSIDEYIVQYTSYYEQLYSDSGIWSEEQIIERYRLDGYARYDEIIDSITTVLQREVVTYTQDETLIRWRTKVILLSFHDVGDIRTITNIEIR